MVEVWRFFVLAAGRYKPHGGGESGHVGVIEVGGQSRRSCFGCAGFPRWRPRQFVELDDAKALGTTSTVVEDHGAARPAFGRGAAQVAREESVVAVEDVVACQSARTAAVDEGRAHDEGPGEGPFWLGLLSVGERDAV